MKKLLLLSAIAFAAVSASAQITVTAEGQPVANGGTVNSKHLKIGYDTQEFFGVTVNTTTFQLDPEVMVAASPAGRYVIRVTNNTTDNYEGMPGPQICWPENCVGVGRGQTFETKPGELTPTPQTIQLDSKEGYVTDWDLDPGEYWPEVDFTLACKVEIVPENGSSPVFTFNVNMTYDPTILAGVDDITVDNDAPVVYYDLTGRQVLNPAKGQIVIERQGSKARKVIM